MLSEEEKKAIEELKHYCNLTQYWKNVEYAKSEFDDYINTVLQVIETQQKEIVKLKKDYSDMLLQENVISKDKIKEKIKKYDEWIKEDGDYVESLEAQRYALKELLEE